MSHAHKPGIAVFSDSCSEHDEALFNFGKGLSLSGNVVLVTINGLDIALLDEDERGLSLQERFQTRELVQAHAAKLAYNGYRIGAIVPHVNCDDKDPDFEYCRMLLREERDVLMHWGVFTSIHTACLVPDGRIISVSL